MANGWSVIFGLVICVALAIVAWIFSPKGENQVLWRSSIILAIASCYLMWAITFMAQLYPLIEPRRSDLRAEYLHD